MLEQTRKCLLMRIPSLSTFQTTNIGNDQTINVSDCTYKLVGLVLDDGRALTKAVPEGWTVHNTQDREKHRKTLRQPLRPVLLVYSKLHASNANANTQQTAKHSLQSSNEVRVPPVELKTHESDLESDHNSQNMEDPVVNDKTPILYEEEFQPQWVDVVKKSIPKKASPAKPGASNANDMNKAGASKSESNTNTRNRANNSATSKNVPANQAVNNNSPKAAQNNHGTVVSSNNNHNQSSPKKNSKKKRGNNSNAGHAGQSGGGLSNVGNTCYINSALQIVLTHLKPTGPVNAGEIIQGLQRIQRGMRNEGAMDQFVDMMERIIKKDLRRQSDAAEFLQILFSLIDKEDPNFASNFRLKNYGTVQKCNECERQSAGRKKQDIYQVLLSAVGSSVQEKFDKQLITEKPQFYCPHCDRSVDAGGQEIITFAAETLIIVLPWVYESSRLHIDENQPLVMGEDIFFLTGMVLHRGNNEWGHYTAVARSPDAPQQWKYCNDSSISYQSSVNELSERPTVLVYSKVKSTEQVPKSHNNSISDSPEQSSGYSLFSQLRQAYNYLPSWTSSASTNLPEIETTDMDTS